MISENSKDFFHISKGQYFYWLAFILICFFSYYYMDIETTTRHGINFWKALFDGDFFQFYSYNNTNPSVLDYQRAAYEILIYIVFGLWDFPLYIIELITKQNSLTFIPCILYSKGILFFFFFVTIKTFRKICDELDFSAEKKETCTFFWASSFFVIEPLFVICQYDIICLFFILNGVLSYIINDKKQFILWFAAALPFKTFALFIFLPLLFIKEKNIFKLITIVFICSFPLLLCKSIYIFTDPTYTKLPLHPAMHYILTDAQFMADCFLNRQNTIHLPMGNPTIFVTLYTGFLAICYFFINKTDAFIALLTSAVSFSILFIFSWTYPYWIILISPFVALLCFYSQSKSVIYKNLVFEFIFSGAFAFSSIYKFYFQFNSSSLMHLLLRYKFFKIIPEKFTEISNNYPFHPTGWKYEIQKVFSIYEYITVPIAVAVFSVFLILFLLYVYYDYRKSDSSKTVILFKTLNPFLWIRTSITGFVAIAQILLIVIARFSI